MMAAAPWEDGRQNGGGRGTGGGTPQGSKTPLPGPGEPWTPIRLSRWSGEYLEGRGVAGGRLDAELILAHVLRLRRLDLYLQHDRPLLPVELDHFKSLLKRRAAREPLQYVLGSASFRDLELLCDPRALIPRPETEVLVGEVLAWARDRDARVRTAEEEPAPAGTGEDLPALDIGTGKDLSALDIGTGSGVIALSLLREGPFGAVVATDPSGSALELARSNAERCGQTRGLDLRKGALFDPVRPGERFHVLVSNPPYVPDGDRPRIAPEVRDWEPAEALFAGPEGLDVLIPLVQGAGEVLLPGGLLALEVGDGQAGRVARIMDRTASFREIRIRPDLAGKERIVLGVA